uniref:Uncharacterized protein n=1 Tax=Anguilla anguilla TaxID=7936 RepID=A0A0E9TTC2_ANGAN
MSRQYRRSTRGAGDSDECDSFSRLTGASMGASGP